MSALCWTANSIIGLGSSYAQPNCWEFLNIILCSICIFDDGHAVFIVLYYIDCQCSALISAVGTST